MSVGQMELVQTAYVWSNTKKNVLNCFRIYVQLKPIIQARIVINGLLSQLVVNHKHSVETRIRHYIIAVTSVKEYQ